MKRTTKLENLMGRNKVISIPRAWLPINLTREYLRQIFEKLWSSPKAFNIDKAVAICTLIIINRYKAEEGMRNYFWLKGYSYIHSNEFRYWIGKNYRDYINVLREGQIVEVHDSYLERTYPKSYKIKDNWLQSNDDIRKFKKVDYLDYNLRLKAFVQKVGNWENKTAITERQPLIQYAKDIIIEYDLEELEKYLYSKKLRKPNRIEERELEIIKYTRFKEMDEFWINAKDDFGGRLHTPFTSMKKDHRRFIKIDGEVGVEIDIKNSQMFFLACLCKYPDVANEILMEDWNDKATAEQCIRYIKNEFEQNDDFQQFTERALDGSIYEFIQSNLKKKGKPYKRDAAKKKVFYTIFSDGSKSNETREKMAKLFPTVIKVCTVLNGNDKKIVPKLMQTFESRIMIDKVAVSAVEKGLGKFVTIHDSFICASSQVEKFKSHISEVFLQVGLPVPVLRI